MSLGVLRTIPLNVSGSIGIASDIFLHLGCVTPCTVIIVLIGSKLGGIIELVLKMCQRNIVYPVNPTPLPWLCIPLHSDEAYWNYVDFINTICFTPYLPKYKFISAYKAASPLQSFILRKIYPVCSVC